MRNVIISDASCLIILHKVNQLHLLNLIYGSVIITPEIKDEFGQHIPKWIEVKIPKDKGVQKVLNQTLDLGEASAIALALESENPTLILDDLKARKMANSLQIRITGTLGVIIKAKHSGVLNKVKPILNQLQKTNFRISQKLINEILQRMNES